MRLILSSLKSEPAAMYTIEAQGGRGRERKREREYSVCSDRCVPLKIGEDLSGKMSDKHSGYVRVPTPKIDTIKDTTELNTYNSNKGGKKQ